MKTLPSNAFRDSTIESLNTINITSLGGNSVFEECNNLDSIILYGVSYIPPGCFKNSVKRYMLLVNMQGIATAGNYTSLSVYGKIYITDEYYEGTVNNGTWKTYGAKKTFPLSQFPIDFPDDAEELGIS